MKKSIYVEEDNKFYTVSVPKRNLKKLKEMESEVAFRLDSPKAFEDYKSMVGRKYGTCH